MSVTDRLHLQLYAGQMCAGGGWECREVVRCPEKWREEEKKRQREREEEEEEEEDSKVKNQIVK